MDTHSQQQVRQPQAIKLSRHSQSSPGNSPFWQEFVCQSQNVYVCPSLVWSFTSKTNTRNDRSALKGHEWPVTLKMDTSTGCQHFPSSTMRLGIAS